MSARGLRLGAVDGPVQRAHAGGKLAIAIALVLTASTTTMAQWPLLLVLFAVLVVVALVARVPAWPLLRRLLWLEPFVLGLAGLALLQPDGLLRGGWLLLRSNLCLLTMLLLAATTPFPALLAVLRALRLPKLLLTTVALTFRYLAVLADEAQRMQRARQCRSARVGGWPGWQVLATVPSQLFVRTTARAERIHAAMVARGLR